VLESLIPIGLSVIFFLGTAVLSGVLAGPTARLKIKDEHVEVIPLGIWKFWALRRRLRIPVDAFETVEIRSDAYSFPRGVRAPGTRIPNFMVAGTYRSGALGTLFLISRRKREVLVADFETEKVQRLIVQVSNAEKVKAMLLEQTGASEGEIELMPARAKSSPRSTSRRRTRSKKNKDDNKGSEARPRKHGKNNPGLPRARQRKRG